MCTASGANGVELEFLWLRGDQVDGSSITNDSTVHAKTIINSTVSQLMFTPLQVSHKGSVTCQVMLKNSVIYKDFNITVKRKMISVCIQG